MSDPVVTVRRVNYETHRETLRDIRRRVFIEEQGVPEVLEWDDIDPHCEHVLAFVSDGTAVATARLLPDGHIGRMAVLASWRGKGIGSAMLNHLVQRARECGFEVARLHAQTHALGFYARHGFEASGEEFLEAGIPHYAMVCRLRPVPPGRVS
jgi:predicted GNAT family N-acyltransferase